MGLRIDAIHDVADHPTFAVFTNGDDAVHRVVLEHPPTEQFDPNRRYRLTFGPTTGTSQTYVHAEDAVDRAHDRREQLQDEGDERDDVPPATRGRGKGR